MKFKHNSRSYSKNILKLASFLIILLIIFTQNSILQSENPYLDQTMDYKEDELIQNKNDSPQSALDELVFDNGPLFFIVNEKGYIDYSYYNFWFNGYYHDYYWMSYLSINDGTVRPLDEFLVIKSLTNLTEFVSGYSSRQLVAESIIKHPEEDVYVKIQIKLYPFEEFFVMTYMIWSDTINIDKAELFFYDDVDMDSTTEVWDSLDDNADYDGSTELIYTSDKDTKNTLGRISLYPISSWDLDTYDVLLDNVNNDNLKQTISLTNQEVAVASKYIKNNLNINETWVVPLIYGFATSEAGVYSTTVDVKDDFINDFSVLDFTANLTDYPSVNATILNGGQNLMTRNISVFRNGTYLQSQEITLSPGQINDSVIFDNLLLNSGEYNEITVSVNSTANDYEPNNEISHTYLYQDRFRINIKDLDGFDVEGLNISLYQKGTPTLIDGTFTNEFGNASFIDLPEDDYTLKVQVPWVNSQIIYEENFTYPDVGEFLQIQSNLTTFVLHIEDVEGNSVENASIDISEDLNPSIIIWSAVTDQNGNLTFQYINQTYDINVSYYDYQTSLELEDIPDLILLEKTHHTHQVNLTKFIIHLKTRSVIDPIDLNGTKLEFYKTINSEPLGDPIGFEIADSNGNVSICWDARINYSIRFSFFNIYFPIGDPEADEFNFTESPYNSYEYLDLNVSFGNPDDYSTEIILLNSLPISYTWEDNIDFIFMFNVSGPIIEESKWADKTLIEIFNKDYDSVYNGTATNIIGQEGYHRFVVNTSSGNFTSNNPETYTVNIFAQNYSYGEPAVKTFTFNIYNITTDKDLHSSSETLYWKDNFTISAYFYEKLTSDPIIDGNLTVTWGSDLINYPMENLGNGTYTIEINSSLGSPGNSVVNVQCFRENYNSDNMKFYLDIREIPTTVNGSILFSSGHSQYVTAQNLTVDYDFIDSYRNISIPDLSPMYQIINSETEEQYTGYLTYNESGLYTFDPKSALLPIGTYHGLIDFSLDNYVSSYASVQFEILPIPLFLTFEGGSTEDENDFEASTEYSIERGENLYFSIDILDIYENPVQHCNISYELKFTEDNESQTGYLLSDNMGHYYGNFSELSEIGLYSLSLTVYKANHTVETYQYYIDVEYETYFGGIPLPYLLIGAIMLLIAISAAVGYAGIKRMKIPRYIKDLTKLEKILKNTNNILPERYPTRIEQLESKYGSRWEQLDLKFPLQPHIDDIKNFIIAYQDITGKLFLKEEAKQFLDDLVIYSEEEIKRRLEDKRIFGENLSKLMEIIINYIKVTSAQHDLEFETDKVKDDFDLEFGDDK